MLYTQIQILEFAMKWKEEGADRHTPSYLGFAEWDVSDTGTVLGEYRRKHNHVGKPKTVPREGRFYSGIWGISRKTFCFPKSKTKIPDDIAYMWNLKYDTKEPLWNRQTHRHRKQICGCQGWVAGEKNWEFGISRCIYDG